MVNRARKGYTKEKKIRDELKKDGWFIAFKSVRYKFGCIDLANLFDVLALKGKERKFISAKHLGAGNYYQQHQKEIKEFKDEFGLEGESYELWLWDAPRWKGRGKNKQWNSGGFIKVVL